MLNGFGCNLDRNDATTVAKANAPFFHLAAVICDLQVHMIEGIVVQWLVVDRVDGAALAIGPNQTAHGEASAAVLLSVLQGIAPSDWHVVHNPVMLIVQADALFQDHHLAMADRIAALVHLCASLCALLVLQELNLIRPGSNTFAEDHLSQILYRRVLLLAQTEIKVMIFVRDDGFLGVQSVNVQDYIRLEEIINNRYKSN